MAIKAIKKIIYFIILTGLLVSLFLGYKFNQFQTQPIHLETESALFTIYSGNTIRQVAQNLADKGYIIDPLMFIALAKLNDEKTHIKAGEYRIKSSHSPQDLIQLFKKGNSILYSFTIIEGWTFKQMLKAIKANPVLINTIESTDNSVIMARIGHPDKHPEGQFLPDTYHFPRGTTDISFLKRAYHTMQDTLQKEWESRDSTVPLKSPYEALILASIIEKETGAAFERPLISAAFIQRLNKKMRLQTDPTIIYGLGDSFDGNIRYKDLRKDTPYNTYLHKGLTPTPIALPGGDAIRAALHPAKSEAIYFVSKGDGTHHFSKTLTEHNAAVTKYQLKGRKPKRKASPG
jgi:UPF0755 protein